jgi:hypothetical protein
MISKNGIAARLIGRGDPEFDLLGSGIDRENNSASAQAQATPIVVTIRGPAVRPGFTRSGIAYSPAKTRKIRGPRPSGRSAYYGRSTALGLSSLSDCAR